MPFKRNAMLTATAVVALLLVLVFSRDLFASICIGVCLTVLSVISLWMAKFSRLTAVFLALCFCGVWLFTETVGCHQTLAMAKASLQTSTEPSYNGVARLAFDPVLSKSVCQLDTPWYYVGHPFSPCPFITSFEFASMNKDGVGNGGRFYFLWLGGYHVKIHLTTHWVAC